MTNTLDHNWIVTIVEWRKTVAVEPEPFNLPPIMSSANYLLSEAGELHDAIHTTDRHMDLRNPSSQRSSVIDELGDVLLMLGTVAHQMGIHTLEQEDTPFSQQPLRLSRRIIDETIKLLDKLDFTMYFHSSDELYPKFQDHHTTQITNMLTGILWYILGLCRLLEINPDVALSGTFTKIETRRNKKILAKLAETQ